MRIASFIQNKLKSRNFFDTNIKIDILKNYFQLFSLNNINLCYNKFIPSQYDPQKRNVLLAIESPAVIEHEKWLNPEMKFVAEISFANYYKLDNYLSCRDLYVNLDAFINVVSDSKTENKTNLVSMVCSDKKILPGHKLRHEIVEKIKGNIDVFGSGYHKFGNIDTAYYDYLFQIVVENGKHPEYVSEKLYDCLKTKTIPIYWGGDVALKKMGFEMKGILTFDNIIDLPILIAGLNRNLYQKMFPFVLYNYSRLIELRNENKMKQYLNSVLISYMQTPGSYSGFNFNQLNVALEKK